MGLLWKSFVALVVTAALGAATLATAPPSAKSGTAAVDVAVSGSKVWALAANGRVEVAGGAGWFGDTSTMRLNGAPRALVATPSGNGYWIMGADCGVFTFGDAAFYGSTGAMRLNAPVISMTPTPSGRGYWLLASDGGVFTFGDAAFYGSTGAMRLNAPVVAMAATPTGRGYWLAAADGGVFTFGDATFRGSAVGRPGPVVALAATDGGYVQLLADGTVVEWPSGATVLAPSAPPVTGPHSFMGRDPSGRPSRWDPCRPVRIEVNFAGAYPGAAATLAEAVTRLRAASGLDVRIVGTTTGREPSSAADMVVHWTPASTMPPGVWGMAWLRWYSHSLQIISAKVEFNADAPVVDGFGTSRSFGTLALHELAHAVGLGHVDATDQIMYPVMRALPGYGNGDREGLWRVGSAQGCFAQGFSTMSAGDAGPVSDWVSVEN